MPGDLALLLTKEPGPEIVEGWVVAPDVAALAVARASYSLAEPIRLTYEDVRDLMSCEGRWAAATGHELLSSRGRDAEDQLVRAGIRRWLSEEPRPPIGGIVEELMSCPLGEDDGKGWASLLPDVARISHLGEELARHIARVDDDLRGLQAPVDVLAHEPISLGRVHLVAECVDLSVTDEDSGSTTVVALCTRTDSRLSLQRVFFDAALLAAASGVAARRLVVWDVGLGRGSSVAFGRRGATTVLVMVEEAIRRLAAMQLGFAPRKTGGAQCADCVLADSCSQRVG